MKVYTRKPEENWIVDRLVQEFSQKTSHQIVSNPENADVIFLLAGWIWNQVPIPLLQSKKVIKTIHHVVPEKFNKQEFNFCDQFIDLYHVPNKHTKAFLETQTKKPIKQICYWLNDKLFFETKESKKEKDKIVLFNNYRDTEGAGISKGIYLPKKEKGADIMAQVFCQLRKDKYSVLLTGYRRHFIIEELKKIKMSYSYMEMAKNPNEAYSFADYFISCSRHEGGSQAILESSQTKTKILSTDVGIASEILHPDCLCYSIDDFVDKIENNKIEETIEWNYENVQNYTLDKMIKKYDKMIEEL